MYSPGSESLIKQAREIQDAELQKFYSRIVKFLQGKDFSHETINSLQRLHLILSATKYTRALPPELQKRLLALLLSTSVEQLQVLSSAVLRETLAPTGQEGNYTVQEPSSPPNSHAAALLLSQTTSRTDVSSFCAQLLRSLEGKSSEGLPHSLTHTLPILNSILSHCPECLTEDHVTLLSKKMVDWLRYASTQQGGGVSVGGFFTGPRLRQPGPIAELDGTVSGDFFTVLCVGQGFTEDQWMNVHSFSMLRHWLLTCHSSGGNITVDTDLQLPTQGAVIGQSGTRTVGRS